MDEQRKSKVLFAECSKPVLPALSLPKSAAFKLPREKPLERLRRVRDEIRARVEHPIEDMGSRSAENLHSLNSTLNSS